MRAEIPRVEIGEMPPGRTAVAALINRANTPVAGDLRGLRIALLSQWLPRFDASAAAERVHRIVQILLAFGAEVLYVHWATTNEDEKYRRAMEGVRLHRASRDVDAIAGAIAGFRPHVVWLTNVWTPELFQLVGNVGLRLRKHALAPAIVFDTIDFHAKKFQRKFGLSGDPKDAELAERFLRLEREFYPAADRVVVVTDGEREDLRAQIPDAPAVEILPTIHPVAPGGPGFAPRRHFAFLGNFRLDQNVDAVRLFVREVFPLLCERFPDAELHLLGRDAEEALPAGAGERRVRAVGFVADVAEALSRYRVFVCPVTYGAGIKGKIGAAAGAGLPFVTTTVGAEGFPVRDGVHCFLADEPGEFARKCAQLYEDAAIWSELSVRGRLMIAEHFSIAAASRALLEILAPYAAAFQTLSSALPVATHKPEPEARGLRPTSGLTRRSTVAALIPHFRCEEWLGDCLASLVAQTRPLDAIIVIDDASEAPPVEIVRRFPQVTLLAAAENSGPYRLITEVMRNTDYDGYLFQDADDWSAAERLEVLLAEAERTGAELIGSHEVRILCDQAEALCVPYPLDVNAALAERPWQYLVLHPSSLVSRDLVMRIGGYASGMRFCGDLEFLHRAVHATRIVNAPHYCYFRRIRSGSLTTAAETSLGSAQRTQLHEILGARAIANARLRTIGEVPALTPYIVGPPIALAHLAGPSPRCLGVTS